MKCLLSAFGDFRLAKAKRTTFRDRRELTVR